MSFRPQTSRLLSLPYETRLQIYQHTTPTETELCFCPCINHPPRSSETAVCLCYESSVQTTHEASPVETPLSLAKTHVPSPRPEFLIGTEEFLSSLPLTCRQIFADTRNIVQNPKLLTLCSPRCLTSLLSTLPRNYLAFITKITMSIDLRIFRHPTFRHLASFHDIWICIYNTRIATDQSIRKFYVKPSVERMNADIIAPELGFYPLVITTGRPFNQKEIAFRRFWHGSSKVEQRLTEFMKLLGNRNREGLTLSDGSSGREAMDLI
jgi:hypothetical protein